jgi:hypothetical protein
MSATRQIVGGPDDGLYVATVRADPTMPSGMITGICASCTSAINSGSDMITCTTPAWYQLMSDGRFHYVGDFPYTQPPKEPDEDLH